MLVLFSIELETPELLTKTKYKLHCCNFRRNGAFHEVGCIMKANLKTLAGTPGTNYNGANGWSSLARSRRESSSI